MIQFIALAVFAGAAWYFMDPEDRTRARRFARRMAFSAHRGVVASCFTSDQLLRDLRARTRWIVVVPAIAVLSVAVYAQMIFAPGEVTTETILAWGGNSAPSTGSGEWWRLLSATFVHVSFLSLVINTGALLSAGRVLERLLGPFTFATVYLACGAFGALTSLWIAPLAVTGSGSAAVFGMYGLLLACWMWGAFRHSTTTVRLANVKLLAVPAAMFILYSVANPDLETSAEIAGLTGGFVAGLLLTRKAAEQKPAVLRVAASAVAAALIVFLLSEPVRGVVDPRREIEAVITLERETTARYEGAVSRFRNGQVKEADLALLIDGQIVPSVAAANRRIMALQRVPQDDAPTLVAAKEYLRVREASWRLRAQALQKRSVPMLREAEKKERLALHAFEVVTAKWNDRPIH